MNAENINTIQDIKNWFEYLILVDNLCLHPDLDFEDYVNVDRQRTYSDFEATVMNETMEKCFVVAHKEDVDVYGIAIDCINS